MLNVLGSRLTRCVAPLLLALGVSLPASAMAEQPAFTTSSVYMRAGPSTAYPAVVRVPARAPIGIDGCVAGYTWCDANWNGFHGWIAARYIRMLYQGRPAPLAPDLGALMGLAIVEFDHGYWDRYYAGRPWFHRWDRFAAPAPAPEPMARPHALPPRAEPVPHPRHEPRPGCFGPRCGDPNEPPRP